MDGFGGLGVVLMHRRVINESERLLELPLVSKRACCKRRCRWFLLFVVLGDPFLLSKVASITRVVGLCFGDFITLFSLEFRPCPSLKTFGVTLDAS